jgi:hypothetical protein
MSQPKTCLTLVGYTTTRFLFLCHGAYSIKTFMSIVCNRLYNLRDPKQIRCLYISGEECTHCRYPEKYFKNEWINIIGKEVFKAIGNALSNLEHFNIFNHNIHSSESGIETLTCINTSHSDSTWKNIHHVTLLGPSSIDLSKFDDYNLKLFWKRLKNEAGINHFHNLKFLSMENVTGNGIEDRLCNTVKFKIFKTLIKNGVENNLIGLSLGNGIFSNFWSFDNLQYLCVECHFEQIQRLIISCPKHVIFEWKQKQTTETNCPYPSRHVSSCVASKISNWINCEPTKSSSTTNTNWATNYPINLRNIKLVLDRHDFVSFLAIHQSCGQ